MRKTILSIFTIVALSLLPSCGSGNASHSGLGDPIELRHANNLRMFAMGDTATLVSLRNPWDTVRNMARYVLVERGHAVPDSLPAGTIAITVPVEQSVVYSGVHASLIDELGALGAINGMCDVGYVNDGAARNAIATGTIADCGSSQSPNMERIVSLHPQIIILSPYEKSDEAGRFSRTGISVVKAADYLEQTPLGRAEWMRFFGRLYGKGSEADSLFNTIEKDYESLRQKTARSEHRPAVLFDRIYSGVWDVPTARSVTGRLIEDAGGSNPFGKRRESGSAHFTAEEVLYNAQNANIWLVRYFEPSLTLKSMKADNPIYAKFKAFKNGNVFGANTLEKPLFEDGAFHPNLTLREMVRLLHPEIDNTPTVYYKKIQAE